MMNHIQVKTQSYFPGKIICIGRNYAAHARELHNQVPSQPVVFLKPNSAISQELFAFEGEQVHFEAELSFMIKQQTLSAVAVGLDLTKREVQAQLKSKGLPWERAKAFDKSAVFTPFVAFKQLSDLRFTLSINGALVQQGNYAAMIFKPPELLAEIKSFLSLQDGDVLMTGTPAGVGPYQKGDTFNAQLYENDHLILNHYWEAI